jgi:hypothetical protein
MDGTASLANREIGRVLPANYRRVSFSGAVDHLNRAATARYFGQLAGESLETRTRWRSKVDSNQQFRCFVIEIAGSQPVSILRRHRPALTEKSETDK